jgi:hypothetical protein
MSRVVCGSLVVALLTGFVVLLAVLLRQRVEAGLGLPAYSVYSEVDDGLGEAAHLLRGLGWTPVALTHPIQAAHVRGLLILNGTAPEGLLESDPLTPADAQALLRWVGRGNTLLLASAVNTRIHQALDVVVTHEPGPKDTFAQAEPASTGRYLHGVRHLSLGSRATLHSGPGAVPLWRLGDRPAALLIRRGQGRVLVVADPGLLTRRGLITDEGEPREDNAVFLANVAALSAPERKVYFDEYHHGIRSGGGFWGYLAYHGERKSLIPLVLALVVAGWAWAVRLGPAVPTPRPRQADAVEYASALGRLYQRSGARRLLARTLLRGFLDALRHHLHLRPQALPAVILAGWRQQHPATADRLQPLLRGVAELRKPDVTDRQLLAWTRAFDAFVRTEVAGELQ